MWNDLSFDVRSFDPESWGPSWGLTWEAAQELFVSGGGPDASDSSHGRTGRTETEADLEHLKRQAEHGRRIYAKDEPVQAQESLPPPVAPAAVAPSSPTPVLFSSAPLLNEAAEQLAEVGQALDQIQADLEIKRKRQAEEEILLLLLAA